MLHLNIWNMLLQCLIASIINNTCCSRRRNKFLKFFQQRQVLLACELFMKSNVADYLKYPHKSKIIIYEIKENRMKCSGVQFIRFLCVGVTERLLLIFMLCVQRSWTTLAGVSPVTVIASEPCS